MSKADITKHRKKHEQENFKSKSFDEVFGARDKLRKHTKKKHRNKKYQKVTCLMCKTKYSNQNSYRVHIQKHHSSAEDVKLEGTNESQLSL